MQQHVYEEESHRFAELAKALPPGESARLSRRYAEEFERSCGSRMSEAAPPPLQMAAQEGGSRSSGAIRTPDPPLASRYWRQTALKASGAAIRIPPELPVSRCDSYATASARVDECGKRD